MHLREQEVQLTVTPQQLPEQEVKVNLPSEDTDSFKNLTLVLTLLKSAQYVKQFGVEFHFKNGTESQLHLKLKNPEKK